MVEISLLLLAVWWAFMMFQSNPVTEHMPVSKVEIGTEKASLVSLKSLVAVPLFGKREVTPVIKKPITQPKPITRPRLDIKLLGTVVAGERSAAIMTVGRSAETTFFLGDVLYGRAFLKQVEAGAVILSNQGNDERVIMSEGKAMTGGRITPPPTVSQYMNSPAYRGRVPPADMVTGQDFPSGGMAGQGLPPGMMNQGFPPGMVTSQGLPPGVINQGLPPGIAMGHPQRQ
ncbi:MAG: type II secretion system protein N [Mariprofundus sp.]|nr:type II secretion system protein N [Mariprofundus sp.]